ncbi:MAG: hypothetical protein HY820_30865 [Acidobacteria bacterium]|nr:hypothetical protein [Acidobacteriota bacterium]
MSFHLKPISKESIPAAIEKVHRYRNLNEPAEAESICLDILDAEPHHQEALVLLLLARTDQIDDGMNPSRAREVLIKMSGEYELAYYAGLIYERTAKAIIKQGRPGSRYAAYEHLRMAMEHYERAEGLRPSGIDDAILRYNTCVRLLSHHEDLQPRPAEAYEAVMNE